MPKIITIDGPSGVGKGTAAGMIADYLQYHLLDSGALYRIAAVNADKNGLDPNDVHDATIAVECLSVQFIDGKVFLDGNDVSSEIRTIKMGQLASKIAVHSAVRSKLFTFMQSFVRLPGIVADGRDMGTVVFPDANLKLFLTASPEIRAKRRYKQLKGNGKDVNLSTVFSELAERDRRDESREAAPLEPAKDAVLIDTGDLGVVRVFDKIKILAAQVGILP